VTWRLAGTLPRRVLESKDEKTSAGTRFVSMDGELDRAALGSVWLTDTRVAQMVVEALAYGAAVRSLYDLHAYVLMPNHVHVVWQPTAMPSILQ
jgi:hypothetical protein